MLSSALMLKPGHLTQLHSFRGLCSGTGEDRARGQWPSLAQGMRLRTRGQGTRWEQGDASSLASGRGSLVSSYVLSFFFMNSLFVFTPWRHPGEVYDNYNHLWVAIRKSQLRRMRFKTHLFFKEAPVLSLFKFAELPFTLCLV